MWSSAIIPTLILPLSIVLYNPLYWKYTGFTLRIVFKPFVNGSIFFLVLLSDVFIHAVPVVFAASPTTSNVYAGLIVFIPTYGLPALYSIDNGYTTVAETLSYIEY